MLDDAAVIGLVDKLIKQRKDSITRSQRAAAPTWSTRRAPRCRVLEAYLPQRLRADEIAAAVAAIVAAARRHGPGRHGQGDGAPPRPQLAGKADMASVSAAVKHALSK